MAFNIGYYAVVASPHSFDLCEVQSRALQARRLRKQHKHRYRLASMPRLHLQVCATCRELQRQVCDDGDRCWHTPRLTHVCCRWWHDVVREVLQAGGCPCGRFASPTRAVNYDRSCTVWPNIVWAAGLLNSKSWECIVLALQNSR